MIKDIVQKGTAPLHQAAAPVDLITERELVQQVAIDITDTIQHLLTTHAFTKGIGLAAPQIGIAKRIFGFAPPQEPVTIYVNPEIVEKSADTDFQYEGCLSFFDVRGRVARALRLRLKYYDVNGQTFDQSFAAGDARIIQHEMDHLDGILYGERMAPTDTLVSYEKYLTMKERDWRY